MSWEQTLLNTFEKHIKEDKQEKPLHPSDFFPSLQKSRPVYHFLADVIAAHLKPASVIDWGCGCGFILEKLQMHGITELCGVEGSVDANPFIPESLKDKIIIADVLLYKSKIYDLAISIEVGEHLKTNDSARFVNSVCNSASKWVWWTSAVPGQGGTGHINCQPLEFWTAVFKDVGLFEPDWIKTYELKQAMLLNNSLCLGFPWLRDNFILFKNIVLA